MLNFENARKEVTFAFITSFCFWVCWVIWPLTTRPCKIYEVAKVKIGEQQRFRLVCTEAFDVHLYNIGSLELEQGADRQLEIWSYWIAVHALSVEQIRWVFGDTDVWRDANWTTIRSYYEMSHIGRLLGGSEWYVLQIRKLSGNCLI